MADPTPSPRSWTTRRTRADATGPRCSSSGGPRRGTAPSALSRPITSRSGGRPRRRSPPRWHSGAGRGAADRREGGPGRRGGRDTGSRAGLPHAGSPAGDRRGESHPPGAGPQQARARPRSARAVPPPLRARRLSGAPDLGQGGGGSSRAARPAAGPRLGPDRGVWRGEVEPRERAPARPESPDRRDQREVGDGEAHDAGGAARAPRRGRGRGGRGGGGGGGGGLRGGPGGP